MSLAKPELHEDAESPPAARVAGRGADAMNPNRAVTLAEAAGMLDMSEKLLGWHLDDGIIPHHTVGKHRRILLRDVLVYKKDLERRGKLLDEIIARDQEMGLYPTKP